MPLPRPTRFSWSPWDTSGYFSQLKMLDFPGLCAPEVVAAEKRLKTVSHAKLIPELQPDWLVLRSMEASAIQKARPAAYGSLFSG